MRLANFLGSIGLSCVMASTASAQWLDTFDSYAPGPLALQSLWEEWSGSTGVDADVVNTLSFTPSNSVMIVTDNDVVYDFANLPGGRPASGVWVASVMTFVPAGTTGTGWYIMMNDYPINLQWSLQIQFDATNGKVIDGTKTRKLVYNRWVEFVVAIDLDHDRYDTWYNSLSLSVAQSWKGMTGQDVIAALDLYGDTGATGSTGMNFDNTRLEKGAGGPLMLNATPNPVVGGQTLKFTSQSPKLTAGDIGELFTWTINGSPFLLPLLPVSFDATGSWTLSATVPTGLAGIEVGLKMLALPAGGKLMMSNEELVVFN
jgi:hypothetical protein